MCNYDYLYYLADYWEVNPYGMYDKLFLHADRRCMVIFILCMRERGVAVIELSRPIWRP